MLKRSLSLLAMLLVMVPMLAFAGTVSTRVMTGGGAISVNGAADQTIANGTVSKSYTTALSIAIKPNTGYVVSAVTLNNGAQALTSPLTVDLRTTSQTVAVSFARVMTSVTATATSPDGTISPSGTTSVYANTVATYTFTPGVGKKVESITVNGTALPAAGYTLDGPIGASAVTSKAVKMTFTVPSSGSVSIVGAFVPLAATAGANQTVLQNTATTLAGAATPAVGTTYEWTQTAGATVSLSDATAAQPTVSFPATGAYTFKLTATNNGATAVSSTTVSVVATPAEAANNQCGTCHTTATPAAVTAYQASVHANSMQSICSSCHSATASHPYAAVGCSNCHSPIVTEFNASIHNTSPTGHESDADFVAAGHGSVASCAAKCHFNQGASKGCAVCHSGALGVGAGNGTGGGSAGVIGASDVHQVQAATVDNTCYACHSGSKHGWSPRAFEKSSHFTGDHAKLYYQFDVKKCLNCHDSHSTEATFGNGLDANGGCASCHHQGTYGIVNADGSGKAPHGGGLPSVGGYVDGTQRTQYLSQGAVCADCHAHNNTINAGYAEGGHGHVSDVAMNAFTHYDWSARTNNGTRQNGNCDRCHTAGGFVKFLGNDTATATRLTPQAGVQNVLVCIGCHKALEGEGLENAPLRTDATPAGNPTPLTGGYFALFSSAAPTTAKKQGEVAAANTKIQIAFPGYKNSSICVPCHSGRSTAAVFTAVIDQMNLVGGNYSTVATSYYQHAANMGQTFISQGAYDLNNKLAAIQANGPSAHAAIKMGATDTQGPCVACHHSTDGKTHSLEIDAASPTCIASACHATAPDVTVAKANFDAGVKALDTLIKAKFAPLQTKVGDLAEERANVRFGRFGKAAGVGADATTAKKAYGAWYNWQILATYDNAAWAHNPRYARQILNDTILYLAADGVIPSSGSAQRDLIDAAINTYGGADVAAAKQWLVAPGCNSCHAAQVTAFATPNAYHAGHKYACANCHTELHMTTDLAAQPTCRCHGDNATTHPTLDNMKAAGANCNKCHGTNDVHSMAAADSTKGCIDCHDVAIAAHNGGVNDNNGVRSIMPEFGKRSHHITGGTPTNAQCVVCHAEGMASNGQAVINPAYHMKDNKTYLRDVDNAGAVFAWDGTNHGVMDNFCFACHDANGANDIETIQAFLPGATKTNPFADTLTNGYDQVARAGVVDVKTAFATTNASHHAVIAPKYQYKFSTRANADAWSIRNGGAAGDVPDSQIAEGKTVDGEVVEFGEETMPADYMTGTHEAEATLYEAGKFVSTYTPLGASESVADNSQLHCGDCHTVGQFKANASTNADGSLAATPIGAHGSANEYMLRNALGTDALHNPRTLVCFNCHKTTFPAGNVTNYNQVKGYATAHSVSAFHGQCVADSALQIGVTNRLYRSERVDRQATWATADGATATNQDSGNITGISCTNCHNSGLRQGWGGIHGGDNTYTDGLGRSQKTYRFMPGMGNYRYAPPGGWDGKDVSDPTLVTKATSGVGAGKGMGGCYTNSALTGSDPNTGYGACNHHGTSTAKSYKAGVPVDVTNGTQRDSYGGGTTASPTAVEPTVREATGGTSLVTRPLKY